MECAAQPLRAEGGPRKKIGHCFQKEAVCWAGRHSQTPLSLQPLWISACLPPSHAASFRIRPRTLCPRSLRQMPLITRPVLTWLCDGRRAMWPAVSLHLPLADGRGQGCISVVGGDAADRLAFNLPRADSVLSESLRLTAAPLHHPRSRGRPGLAHGGMGGNSACDVGPPPPSFPS